MGTQNPSEIISTESLKSEIYNLFPVIIGQRLSYSRENHRGPLEGFSSCLVDCLAISGRDEYLRSLLDENIEFILNDCSLYYSIGNSVFQRKNNALDTLGELSNLASIYYMNKCSNPMYTKINALIKTIMGSGITSGHY